MLTHLGEEECAISSKITDREHRNTIGYRSGTSNHRPRSISTCATQPNAAAISSSSQPVKSVLGSERPAMVCAASCSVPRPSGNTVLSFPAKTISDAPPRPPYCHGIFFYRNSVWRRTYETPAQHLQVPVRFLFTQPDRSHSESHAGHYSLQRVVQHLLRLCVHRT